MLIEAEMLWTKENNVNRDGNTMNGVRITANGDKHNVNGGGGYT